MTNDPVLAVAIRAAHRASSVILDAARDLRRRPAHAKDHGDIAAEAETEAENAIIATLRAAFPDQAIVGAEAGEIVSQIQANTRANEKSYRWIIDPDRRNGEFRPRLPVLRGIDRADARRRGDARRRARSDSRRDLHRDQGQGRAAERHADPDLDVRAGRGCARRHRLSRPHQRQAAGLPPRVRRAAQAVRRRAARGMPARSTSPTSPRDGSTAFS